MATYVNDLRLKEITTGDEAGTWGTSTNTNLKLIGEALGYGTENCFAGNINTTVTVADGASDNLRAMYFKATSSATLTATRTLTIAPNTISRVMLIENATTGGQSIAISQGTGSNVTIPNGQTKMVYLDGAGAGASVVDAFADFSLPTVTAADLTATTADINGGTIDGVTIGGSSAGAGSFTTLTASGDVNFDSGTFFVDASADAVGIGVTNPVDKLDVFGGKIRHTLAGGGPQLVLGNSLNAVSIGSAESGGDADLVFYTSTSSERMRLDASGNVGIGTSSPVANANRSTLALQGAWGGQLDIMVGSTVNAQFGTDNFISGQSCRIQSQDGIVFRTGGSSEAMRIDSSGNVGIGTVPDVISASATTLNIKGAVSSKGGAILLESSDESVRAYMYPDSSVFTVGTLTNIPMRFNTNGSEAMRIDASGNLLVGTTSNAGYGGHVFEKDGANSNTIAIINSATSNPYGPNITFSGASPNDAVRYFLSCSDSTTQRAIIRSNGGLVNYQSNNVDLSDIRTKKDITPAPSYWDKIGALEIVTYKYKDQSHDDVNVGVIAQQVETVEPVWVDNDGFGNSPEGEEPLKTVYTKDITFAAIKALQEAMARIETLEAEVAALKGA